MANPTKEQTYTKAEEFAKKYQDLLDEANTVQKYDNYYQGYPRYSHPCPGCGRCPTCGRGGGWAQPWYPQPYIWCETTTTGQNIGGLTSTSGFAQQVFNGK